MAIFTMDLQNRITLYLVWTGTIVLAQVDVNLVKNATTSDMTGYVGEPTTLHCPVSFDNSGNVDYGWYKYDYNVDPQEINSLLAYRVAFYKDVLGGILEDTSGDLENRGSVSATTGDLTISATTLNDTYIYVCIFTPGGIGQVNLTVIDGRPPSSNLLEKLGGIGIVFAIIVPIVALIVIIVIVIICWKRNKPAYDKKFHNKLPKNKKRDPDVVRETQPNKTTEPATVVYTEVAFPNDGSGHVRNNRFNQPVPTTPEPDPATIYSEVRVPRRS